MEEWREQLVKEGKYLSEKIHKLCEFISSDKWKALSDYERSLFSWQLSAMRSYSEAVAHRIWLFDKNYSFGWC